MLFRSGCDADSIRSKDNISAFVKDLVNKIDMVAFGDPIIEHFGDGNKQGYTLIQMIETSNISAHFVEENNTMYLDIFSCKPYDPVTAIEVVKEYFKTTNYRTAFLERLAPPTTES